MKGISPLIATVLLIGFTVAISGIVSIWAKQFAQTNVDLVNKEATARINCTFGAVTLSSVNYCSTSAYLSGRITNNGVISLGAITLQAAYNNGSTITDPLCLAGSSLIICTSSNLTVAPGYLYSFNISGFSDGFVLVSAITDCPGVNDVTRTWTTNC
ncbi:MAG TPA: archaellin/type IV pilin N-terminal domain-containing protein [archaeon]|nr:archaellin/type IV pilin N-terminal domain-containing protein [archaeon]